MTNEELQNKILQSPGLEKKSQPRGCRIFLVLALGLVGLVGWLIIREALITRDVDQARSVVSGLESWMGSIHSPFPPFASEYYVPFRNREFTEAELARLKVVDDLAAWSTVYVRIDFVDTNLTKEDIHRLQQRFPHCKFYRVVNNEFLIDE